LWHWPLILSHLLSNLAIVVVYAIIAGLLVSLARSRLDLPFQAVVWWFAAFTATCAATHIMTMVELFWPVYWLSSAVNLLAGVTAVVTLVVLLRSLPHILRLPAIDASIRRLFAAVHQAQRELDERRS
jgi:hypothetical protein